MASRTQQLRQSFLLMGAVVALVLVAWFALLSSRSVTRIVERQANERGQDMATHVASLVGMYLRERRREAEALAWSPAVVRAALDGSQQAISRRLPQLDTPTLERMFNQRHVLGGDPELAAYFRDYVQRSEFSELFFTESHGYSVHPHRCAHARRPDGHVVLERHGGGRRVVAHRWGCSRRSSRSIACPSCS